MKIQQAIDNKIKPRGALGLLEDLAYQICEVQDTLTPVLADPTIVVFAADHGVAAEGVSAYPAAVTPAMVSACLGSGAGISVFCRQNGITLKVVDSGVAWPGAVPPGLISKSAGPGTANCFVSDAMSASQLDFCFDSGHEVVSEEVPQTCTVIGFGEVGIGNTSSAALLTSVLAEIPLEDCVGAGTGLNAEGIAHKAAVLTQARSRHSVVDDPRDALRYFGGFEIAQMAAAMLAAFDRNLLLLVDGYVATAAFLAAWRINPAIRRNAVFCHRSAERGHQRALEILKARPILDLGMRLGEGTGAAVAFPIVVSAVAFMNKMASFDEAGVPTGAPEAA
ncbi:MAG: nicotinate-nucleotide--dimethylbenzimidazole phosphoribosyltransferase [Propionibacteriaceae bacterium]|nr:nicotinate-nucleotide--dimethylbenzimidazole phosphoribosyltransferase [Propionibacteriaceae bacterium]